MHETRDKAKSTIFMKKTRSINQMLPVFILILLVQLFLRAHNITELPFFIDEDNHIQRAAVIYDFAHHPAQDSHGKFLFYFLLGVFDLKQRDTALFLAREMVALTSLLTSALIFRMVWRLTRDAAIALLAVALYALIPYALFYERMALADPFAGLLGVLTLWLSLRLAHEPTRGRAVLVGIASAVTVAAKMTMLFAVFFPVMAFLLLAEYDSLSDALRRYFSYLVIAGGVFMMLWLPVLIPAWLSVLDENKPDFVLVNAPELVEHDANASSLFTKIEETWTKLRTLASLPAALVFIGIGIFALWDAPHITGFLLACLLLAWLPSIVFVENLQTRYLMSGIPILVILLGTAAGLDRAVGKIDIFVPLTGLLVVWAIVFALPFANTLITRPPDVNVPPLDAKNYFWDRYNAYGNREAVQYLRENGERFEDGLVYVFPLTKVCPQLDLDTGSSIKRICLEGYYRESMAEIDWQEPAREKLENGVPLYVMTGEQRDVPPEDSNITWEQIAVFPKPHNIQQITLWRLHLR